MKVFLNLLAGTTGGQLTRARAFLDRFENFFPGAELVVVKEKSALREYSSTDKRKVIDVPVGVGRLKALRRMWWENVSLSGLVRECSADVYLTFSHYLPHVKEIRVPTVVGVSNLAPFSREAWAHESLFVKIKMFVLRRTIISSARRGNRVLALSNACREILVEYGVAQRKVMVAPNGVDTFWGLPSSITGLLARLGVVQPYLLYVSHFYRYKNHIRLLEAYAMLPSEVRCGHQLVLIGKPYDVNYYKEIEALIKRYGLDEQVLLIPGESSENLRVVYQQAKLFVFPSLIENCPNILLEAMMAGAPVASSNLSPMPEFCNGSAEYFNPLDASDMANKLVVLLGDATRLKDLSMRSRNEAGKYTWDEFVSKVASRLEDVVGQEGQHR